MNFKIKLHTEALKKRTLIKIDLNLLWDLDKHYSRKENLLFPYLEKYGIDGPTKVIWGIDDAIRLAVRDEEGTYMGTLEFTQNVAGIRALEGQKRILSE